MQISKENVTNAAIEYCTNNNLSVDKLRNQKIIIIDDIFFAQPIETKNSDGLKTDFATRPKPTLIYRVNTGEIEETEYTKKYLSND